MATAIPSPAGAPTMTARQLLNRIRRMGGRIYRMQLVAVFVLTTDEELAVWLIKLGGKRYVPSSADPTTPAGAYRRAEGGALEWDVYIHTIPVLGETTIHEAAARDQAVVYPEEFA
jgi:hypothetical protein